MCDENRIYREAPPALLDLMHEYPELVGAIKKYSDFLGIDWVEREDPADAEEVEIPTIH